MPKATKQSSRPGDDQSTYVPRKDRPRKGLRSAESNAKRSEAMRGKKNPNWKGNKVGYVALHHWVTSRKPKPATCEHCGERPALDLANISGEYRRDVNDWEWLCRSCHMHKDGRINNLAQYAGVSA